MISPFSLLQQAAQWSFLYSARAAFLALVLSAYFAIVTKCMTDGQLSRLREETVEVFYHGFDNYMKHAFPEDELKPVSCMPLARDRENPGHIELNDALGNYSLTLVDSLSTLAILASSPEAARLERDPLADFQHGVVSLVELYGDGTNGTSGQGKRAKGFDLDSKVQVFETVIRGVGGLLSAHLFAVGELPMHARLTESKAHKSGAGLQRIIRWRKDFTYDGQLLRLATDLALRLLPAFHTDTGLPYPRVNLRHGVPFYPNSPLNADAAYGICGKEEEDLEITETCSAGAGSLVLEFSTLSRLTGDSRFEELAKRAFWAVWERKSIIGLVGAGIDAESGKWVNSFTGIGAGIDSFFEYAVKSHILLSGVEPMRPAVLSDLDVDFLAIWKEAHLAIKQHIYRGADYQHPHYIQTDLHTGAMRAFWIDSLSAYYPGLLTLAGEVEEAIQAHMLYAALWTRYSAMPERWSVSSGNIEGGLRWWGGRPEFIESTWYLYRATKDPWYLHIAEMALDDITRRCWTECGWAGLEDVRTGELKDRMESFFLGETVKYLYLLFDPAHPLNHADDAFVFTTEGHPLIIPRSKRRRPPNQPPGAEKVTNMRQLPVCPAAPAIPPFSISAVTSRQDFFHAASLARLHEIGSSNTSTTPAESAYDRVAYEDVVAASPTNFTFYPWTLPAQYIPSTGWSSKMMLRVTFDLSFPPNVDATPGPLSLKRVSDGVEVGSISGLKFGMIREPAYVDDVGLLNVFRVHSVGHMPLGKHEKVWLSLDKILNLNPTDQYFTRHREVTLLELIVDTTPISHPKESLADSISQDAAPPVENGLLAGQASVIPDSAEQPMLNVLMQQLSSIMEQNSLAAALLPKMQNAKGKKIPSRTSFDATSSTGKGAGPLPDVADAPAADQKTEKLTWNSIYVVEDPCPQLLAAHIPRDFQVIVMKRGGCSFLEKLKAIPAFAPSSSSLQLVIVVSFQNNAPGESPIRPLLDEMQETASGVARYHPIPLIMVEGGKKTFKRLRKATSIGIRRKYRIESQGLRINNLIIT